MPSDVGLVFKKYGHEVIPFSDTLKQGSADELVAATALANNAVLVASDGDMKELAGRYGIGRERFKRLSLVRYNCPGPMAAARIEQAMTLIEHEWNYSDQKAARRLFVEITKHTIRTNR